LAKYVNKVVPSYRHHFSGIESNIEIYGVSYIGEVRHVRKQEDISREV